MTKFIHYLYKNKVLPVFFYCSLFRYLWSGFFFSVPQPSFKLMGLLTPLFATIELLLVIFHKKLKIKSSIAIFTVELSLYTVLETLLLKGSCGAEYCLYACIPGIFLFTAEKRPSPLYFAVLDGIILCTCGFILFYNLTFLPPSQVFTPETLNFFIASQVFYSISVLLFLFYGCLATDSTLRRLERKTIWIHKEMDYVAKHDPLTGLMNRRRTHQIFAEIHNSKRKDNSDYAIAIFDIDNFKKLNDTWGHDAGDQILKNFAKRIWNEFPEPVRIGRWGGEEFVIIFPEFSENTVFKLEEVRQKITSTPIIYQQQKIPVTATFGISSSRKFSKPEDVLKEADAMLLIGKQNGKNRIVVSPQF